MMVFAYLIAIVIANITVFYLGAWAMPVNSFFLIGLDLALRDRIHDAWQGNGLVWKMGLLIVCAAFITWVINRNAGLIALASVIAFSCAAISDSLIYSALSNNRFLVRSNGSNVAGAAVDSVLFPTIAFGAFMPWVILSQFAAKAMGGAVWVLVMDRFGRDE